MGVKLINNKSFSIRENPLLIKKSEQKRLAYTSFFGIVSSCIHMF